MRKVIHKCFFVWNFDKEESVPNYLHKTESWKKEISSFSKTPFHSINLCIMKSRRAA